MNLWDCYTYAYVLLIDNWCFNAVHRKWMNLWNSYVFLSSFDIRQNLARCRKQNPNQHFDFKGASYKTNFIYIYRCINCNTFFQHPCSAGLHADKLNQSFVSLYPTKSNSFQQMSVHTETKIICDCWDYTIYHKLNIIILTALPGKIFAQVLYSYTWFKPVQLLYSEVKQFLFL